MWFYKVLAAQDIRDGNPKRLRMPTEYYEHYDVLIENQLQAATKALTGNDDNESDLAYNDDSAPEG